MNANRRSGSAAGWSYWFLAFMACVGCGGMRLQLVESAQKKPNHVWVFLTAENGDRAVTGLSADDFEIYEDGQLVSKEISAQVLQDPDAVSVRLTLLVLDLSGPAFRSERAARLEEAVQSFVQTVTETQDVAVYAFDGSEKLHPIASVGRTAAARKGSEGEAAEGEASEETAGKEGSGTEREGAASEGSAGANAEIEKALASFELKDPSTNLHGAVIEALSTLRRKLDAKPRPIKLGSLVVFSNGPDRATRVPADALRREIDDEANRALRIHVIGLGDDIARANLRDIGRDGVTIVGEEVTIQSAFQSVATRIVDRTRGTYLLSYCTPTRSGERSLRIQATTQGEEPVTGSLDTSFNADGFGPPPACDPKVPPVFRAQAPAAASASKGGSAPSRGGAQPSDGGGSDVIDWKPSESSE